MTRMSRALPPVSQRAPDHWTCPRCGYLCSLETCPECGLRAANIAETAGDAAIRYIFAAQLHALGSGEHLRARVRAGGTVAFANVLAAEIAVGAWLGFSSLHAAEVIRDAGMFGPTNTAEVWGAVILSVMMFFGSAVAMPVLWLALIVPLLAVPAPMSLATPVVAVRLLLLAPLVPAVTAGASVALMLAQFSRPVRGEMILRGIEFFSLAGQATVVAVSFAAGQILLAVVISGLSHFRHLAADRGWQIAWRDVVIAIVAIGWAVALVLGAAMVGRA